ncbi:MAG: hypothetical protein EBS19_11800, partial [Spirochaetia bacterium]|nr:hypothetical protein [Spirochaetia bacterium]
MNNRRLEYNPVFESITDSARRYSRISEEENDQNYKKQNAITYAKRILQISGSTLNYFVISIPNPTVRGKVLKTLMDFWSTQIANKSAITFENLFDKVSEQWGTMEKNITSSKEMLVYEGVNEIYAEVTKGLEQMKLAAKIYLEKYQEESKSGE